MEISDKDKEHLVSELEKLTGTKLHSKLIKKSIVNFYD